MSNTNLLIVLRRKLKSYTKLMKGKVLLLSRMKLLIKKLIKSYMYYKIHTFMLIVVYEFPLTACLISYRLVC